MSSKSRRPRPRPKLVPDDMLSGARRHLGMSNGMIGKHISRQDALILAVGLAVNLAHIWNGPDSPPFMQASVEKRANGVSLHVDLIEPTDESDVV